MRVFRIGKGIGHGVLTIIKGLDLYIVIVLVTICTPLYTGRVSFTDICTLFVSLRIGLQ